MGRNVFEAPAQNRHNFTRVCMSYEHQEENVLLANEAYICLIWRQHVQARRETQEICTTMGEGLRTFISDTLSVR